jgi:multiple antibiotic resistance protein
VKTVLYIVVAVDFFGAATLVARLRDRRRTAIVGLATGAVLLVLAFALGPEVLDGLDISAEAAQIAAGIVLLVPAFALLGMGDELYLLGNRAGGPRAGLVPVAVPFLAGPAPLFVVAAQAAREGRGPVAIGIVVALAVGAATLAFATARPRDDRSVVEGVTGRVLGAAMALVSFSLIVDGVLAV